MIVEGEFLQKCMAQAVFDVFEMMVGIETCQVANDSVDCQLGKGDITGVMMIQGVKQAMLYLTLTHQHARLIVSYMTGHSSEDLVDEEIYDGVAEIVNMIAGRAKALLAGTGDYYTITPPFTIVGMNHFIVYKKEVSKVMMTFAAGEGIAYLRMAYF